MKLKHLINLAWLELVRFKSTSIFLILNLSLGLVGFFLLQIFQQSLALQSEEKAQVVLGGDISIDARRAFGDEERAKWEEQFQFEQSSRFISMFTMLRTSNDSRLASVGIFDSAYPLYGKFKLSGVDFSDSEPLVWVSPEIKDNLLLQENQMLEIGDTSFKYAGEILEDPTKLFASVGFAPRVLIHAKYLKDTGLIKQGSTFTENWNYRLKPGTDAEAIKDKLFKVIQDPAVDIETVKDSASDSNRVLKYFTDYLGLVALVALGLCFLCGTYLLQWTFLTKKKTIAIYKTLGLEDTKIVFIYVIQNFLISLIACLLSYAIVSASLPFFQNLLTVQFNLPLNLVFGFKATLITVCIAVFGPLLMVIPQIIEIMDLRPLMLLQNVQASGKISWVYRLWLLFSIACFWMLAVWQSHSYQVASIFTAALVALIIAFRHLNKLILFVLEKISRGWEWHFKYAVRGLTRKPASASLVFTTMSLATMVLSLLPHIKTSIINEIRPENSSLIPSLFLFDIQPEQKDGLTKLGKDILGQDLVFSPLVRSRILKINEEKYERAIVSGQIQTREEDREARFRNRGTNLTYRSQLQDSETLTGGSFKGTHEGEALPKISLDHDYADRVKIKLNDIITFDVQGVELKGQVASFRKIRWTTFQPNFFILFPNGVLEEAPQIFLTSINKADDSTLKKFQLQVSNQFKNVSIIDITRTIETSMKYVDQMALGLQFMAWLAVLVGLFVFVVLLNTQIKERLFEMNLLQILGTESRDILKIVMLQFTILISSSIFFGVLLGLVMAWVLVKYFFNVVPQFDWQYLVILLSIMLPVCALVLALGLRPLKKLNPVDLIRSA